jgi:hypothetical protein
MPIDYKDPAVSDNHRNRFLNYKRKIIINPAQWETMLGKYEDFHWNEIHFKPANAMDLNEVEGVYLFLASPKKANANFINYFFYVGETNNLRRRYKEYLTKLHSPKSGQYKVQQIIKDFNDHLYFYFVELPGLSQIDRKVIEDDFLTAFLPPVNSKYPQGLQSIVLGAYHQ